ncbi:MAG: hypothetical protein JSV89_12875 [Spirochaetaceae bacterium]|nr:MAG: hypothetical protein JSV89_12875 [Spirochaetaceae bacterium]
MIRKMSGLFFLVVVTGITLGCATGSGTRQAGMGEITDLSRLPTNNRGYREITAEQLSPLLEGKEFLLVNVNSSATEIIPDTDFTVAFDEIEENLNRFPQKNQPTVLYCQAGPLSRSAAQDLVELGFSNVVWLDGGINAWNEPHARASVNKHLLLDTTQLDRLLNDESIELAVVDFGRTRMDYLTGHIPGAVHVSRTAILTHMNGVPGMLPPVDQVQEVIEGAGIGNDTRVVIYDESGGLWASRLFWTLEYLGHDKVSLLDGGLSRWIEEGRALQGEEATNPRANFLVRIQSDKLADKEWLLRNLENPRVKVVDTRSPEEYTGVDKRAAHSYFTLRMLGYEDVRLYDGSWAEWGNSEDTPIE